jgi:hypothetical protein
LKSISKICLNIFVREDEKFESKFLSLGGLEKHYAKARG